MKNLILKTAVITLACILGALAIIYGVFAIFFPKTLAKAFDSVANYNLSVHYYERQYQKTNSAQDLFTLCIKTDAYKDSARTQKYLGEFIGLEDFERHCQTLDITNQSRVTTEELLEGKFVCAVYKNQGLEKALISAKETVSDGYTAYNPFLMLYTDSNFNFTTTQLQTIKQAIEQVIPTLTYDSFALIDVQMLESIING